MTEGSSDRSTGSTNTIIFDIDGTLVDSAAWDAELYVESVQEFLGDVHIHTDWSLYKHVTDSGILQQIFEENTIPGNESMAKDIEESFCIKTSKRIQEQPCRAIPGAAEALRQLRACPHWQVGVATGGWRKTAHAKLESAGIDVSGLPVVSSSDHVARTEIMQACRSRMKQPEGRTVYVGDG
ncbi:MAG: HAD family hydrolase, partial [Verrucomicrobiota bacterium]